MERGILVMDTPYYSCTLLNGEVSTGSTKNTVNVDLNYSNLYRVLFSTSSGSLQRKAQEERWEVLKANPDLLNVMVHYMNYLEKTSKYTTRDYTQKRLFNEILSGKWGKMLQVEFPKFPKRTQEIILFYMAESKRMTTKHGLLESVISKIFNYRSDRVTFYYDTFKRIFYIFMVDEKTDEYSNILKLCKYLFADFLLKIEVRWNCYPVIFDKSIYTIAEEGTQRCATII
jgi:hypothetical protein